MVKVKLASGLVICHHFDQIHKRTFDKTPVDKVPESDSDAYTYFPMDSDKSNVSESATLQAGSPVVEQLSPNRRYPLRIRKAPDHLNL